VPRKHPMPAREKAICRRLREFRLWTGLSQAEFSSVVGLNLRAYASYEYERSQLNYVAAWRILTAMHMLNPIWLAEGAGEMLEGRHFTCWSPEDTGLGPRTAFSFVYDTQLKRPLLRSPVLRLLEPIKGLRMFTFASDISGRLFSKERFGDFLSGWLAALPDSNVNDFLNELFRRAAQVFARYPRDKDQQAIETRRAEIYRIEERRRFGSASQNSEKRVLTGVAVSGKLAPVKSQLKNLLADLNRLTREPGTKTKLADFLSAPLTSVSRWLSGEREPGGETTLKMLRWVQEQESQQNTLDSAINTTKGKTQVRSSKVYENTKSSPPKR